MGVTRVWVTNGASDLVELRRLEVAPSGRSETIRLRVLEPITPSR